MSDFEVELEEDLPRGVVGNSGRLVDARWLEKEELRQPQWRYRDGQGRMAGLVLGYREIDGADVGCGWNDDRHVLTVAGSRAGKGVSLIVPNLLLYDGSVLAIDPKGELARVTARARTAKGQKVVILDPFGTNGRYKQTGAFNPLAEIDPASTRAKDDAERIAAALITSNDRDPHWGNAARRLVKALILYALTMDLEDRNLVTVWKLLNLQHEDIDKLAARGEMSPQKALWKMLSSCTQFDGAVSGVGKQYFDRDNSKEVDSVVSTAQTQLAFLDSDDMAAALTRSDFKLADLKTGKLTLYLCLPATSMVSHSNWLRVIIDLALVAFERTKKKPDIPVLMLLDEFPVLGHMPSLEKAAGLVAGFGVKLWVVLQDLSQIQQHYRKSWQTFISNAGVATYWSNSDKETKEFISEQLGQTSVRVEQPTGATPSQRLGGASGMREEMRVQRLIAPDEVERLLARESQRLLLKAAGQRPVILQRIEYYKDKPFDGLWDDAEVS
jgi:type IV secretion system protein VirD4